MDNLNKFFADVESAVARVMPDAAYEFQRIDGGRWVGVACHGDPRNVGPDGKYGVSHVVFTKDEIASCHAGLIEERVANAARVRRDAEAQND